MVWCFEDEWIMDVIIVVVVVLDTIHEYTSCIMKITAKGMWKAQIKTS